MVRAKFNLEEFCSKVWYDIFKRREELFEYATEKLNEVIDKIHEMFKADLDVIADDFNVVILLGVDKFKDTVSDMRPTFWILARVNDEEMGKCIFEKLRKELRNLIGEAWDSGNFRMVHVEDLPLGYKYYYGSMAEEVIRKIRELRGELNEG